MSDIAAGLRVIAADPMWPDHVEVNKRVITAAADEIERLWLAEIDAARYRWLRRQLHEEGLVIVEIAPVGDWNEAWAQPGTASELDGLIDTAIKRCE